MRKAAFVLSLLSFGTVQATLSAGASLPGQGARFPLTTRVTQAEANALARVFDVGLGKVDVKLLPQWRTKLQARAKAGDPLAQYMYARTYDLFATNQGTAKDAKIAMQWYKKAADQKFASAELFLFNVYTYNLLGQPQNLNWAATYLRRAYEHSGGSVRAEAALELARQTNPDREDPRLPGFQSSLKQTRAYLEEILSIDPTYTTALDWLMGIYMDAREYSKALALAERTDNSAMWQIMGRFLMDDHPQFPAQPKQALKFLKRYVLAHQDDPADIEVPLYDLMALECEKKINRSDYQDIFRQDVYERYLSYRQGCRVPPGG